VIKISYDITGKRFGYLTVIRLEGSNNRKERTWRCKCDCGKETVVPSYRIRHGGVTSCGCHQRDCNYRSKKAKNNPRLYRVFKDMHRRCQYEKDPNYPNYGGRGIKVSEVWSKFDDFCDWALEHGYDANAEYGACTLDRIDTNKDYFPENCRFVDMIEQSNNRRNNHYIVFNGKKQTVTQWEREYNLYSGAINSRLKKGLTIEEAITKPITRKRRCS